MHEAAYQFVARCLQSMPPPGNVVEIGGRDVNGSVRHLFGGAFYISVDIAPGPGVDMVCDGAAYTPPIPPDCVVCCECLEHAPNAREIIANAHRILAPGGHLILTAATTGRVPHGCNGGPVGDEFYEIIDRADLQDWLAEAGFQLVGEFEIDPSAGDIRALAVQA